MCVDDASQLAYTETLPSENPYDARGFLKRALAWLARHGVKAKRVMTDNGAGYSYRRFAAVVLSAPRATSSPSPTHRARPARPSASFSPAYEIRFRSDPTHRLNSETATPLHGPPPQTPPDSAPPSASSHRCDVFIT